MANLRKATTFVMISAHTVKSKGLDTCMPVSQSRDESVIAYTGEAQTEPNEIFDESGAEWNTH